ncbi:hypothetical protein AV521_28580 [Streptomyces sp. IMTB 2501]|nr:hypothetical protein AV521_28580 [Streptomyces sp. IMTB 2501]
MCEPTAEPDRVTENRTAYAVDVEDGTVPTLPGNADPYSILWWSPASRYVIPASSIRINRTLRRRLRQTSWTTTVDRCFDEVLKGCRENRDRQWLMADYMHSLTSLHEAGRVQSLEVWEESCLVGGLFGLSLGKVFVMESAFHRVPDAAKAAIADLAERAARVGLQALDAQVRSDYTVSMGASPMSRKTYLELLADDGTPQRIPSGEQAVARLVERAIE